MDPDPPRRTLPSSLAALSLAALSLAGALLAGCTSGGAGGDGFPEEALTTITSESGALTLEIRTAPQQPPARGVTDIELVARDSKGDLRDDLKFQITPWMPDMGHGSATHPVSDNLGAGRYEVEGVTMVMAGRWELETEITGGVEDSALIVFQIP